MASDLDPEAHQYASPPCTQKRVGAGVSGEGTPVGSTDEVMDFSTRPLPRPKSVPSDRRRLIGKKHSLKPRDVWAIRVRLQLEHRKSELALFNLAINSTSNLVIWCGLQVDDVCAGGRVRDRATIIQTKTGRPVQFEITEQTRASIQD